MDIMEDIIVVGVSEDRERFAILADNGNGTMFSDWVDCDLVYNNLVKIKEVLQEGCDFVFSAYEDIDLGLNEIRNIVNQAKVIKSFSYEIEDSFIIGNGCVMRIEVICTELKGSIFVDASTYVILSIDKFCKDNLEVWEDLDGMSDEELYNTFCSPCSDYEKSLSILKFLISAYDLREYCGWNRSVPIMSFLNKGYLMEDYNNPYNGRLFRERYGVQENPIFKYPLMDHVFLFKDSKKNGYIITNPYLSNIEVRQMINCLDIENNENLYGSYKGLDYIVHGKNLSFWAPGKTNCVLFRYVKEKK